MSADVSVSGAGAARRRWLGPVAFVAVGVLLLGLAPVALSPLRLDLLAKYLCYANVAVGNYLVWGRGGQLTVC